MAHKDACKIQTLQFTKKLTDNGMSLNQACKETEHESDGIPAETIRRWWYETQKEVEELFNNEQEEQSQGKTDASENKIRTEVDNVSIKPLCKICQKRAVIFHGKTRKLALHGMCDKCRKEHNRLQKESKKSGAVEINQNHQQVWEEINIKLESLVEYIYQWGRSPACIEQRMKNEIKDTLRRLTVITNSMIWGKNGNNH